MSQNKISDTLDEIFLKKNFGISNCFSVYTLGDLMKDYNVIVFVLSLLINVLIIKSSSKYGLFLDPVSGNKLQSFHKKKTPRAGGLSIYLLSLIFTYFSSNTMFLIVLSFLPSFAYGLYEDIKGDTPQKFRLIIMALSTLIACMVTGVKVQSIGIMDIPEVAQIPFTVFGVIGLASAINFIDGLNGLASGVTMMAFFAMGIAAQDTGNYPLGISMFLIASSMLGFFVFNFPYGRIFMGDAGAYFLGYMLAMSSSALVLNNSEISPWYPVALLGYPIIETFFTMWRRYRRLKKKGVKFFTAEKVHLHSLLYLRVLKNNSLASMSIVTFFSVNAFIAYQFKESHIDGIIIFLLEAVVYLYFYKNIVNFRIGRMTINAVNTLKNYRAETNSESLAFGKLLKKSTEIVYNSEESLITDQLDKVKSIK